MVMTMTVVYIMAFGGWEIVPAVLLFGASLYGFLSAEIAEEIVVAEIASEIASEVAEEAVEETASAAAGAAIH